MINDLMINFIRITVGSMNDSLKKNVKKINQSFSAM